MGASEDQITALAESMGLPPAGDVPPSLLRRAYITIIRRNWHLLPYNQLLKLVEMSPEHLAFALREDDFLFIKLGNLKPKCSPIVFKEPDASQRERAAQIKRLVDSRFVRFSRRAVSRDSRLSIASHAFPPASGLLSERKGKGRVTCRRISEPSAILWPTVQPIRSPTGCWRGLLNQESTASGFMSCSASLRPEGQTFRNSARVRSGGWPTFAGLSTGRGNSGSMSIFT